MYDKRKGMALLLAGLLLCTLFVSTPDIEAAEQKEPSGAGWMSEISDETPLSALSVPGTHDSCTQYVGMSYIFQCQDTDVLTQLEHGYRYLDLRLVIGEKDGEPVLVIKHNFASCRKDRSWFSGELSLADVLADVYRFLEEHPTETVILCMKAENDEDDIGQIQSLLYQEIDKNQELWYLRNEIPAMSEVRGKAVLATRFEDVLGVGEERTGLFFGWTDQGERDVVDIPYVLSMINDSQALWVQDRYNYNIADKLDAVYDDLGNCQADENTFSLNFTSTSGSGKIGHPKKYAREINRELVAYDWRKGTCYGVIVVDFATEELAAKIYETNE